ncbi:ABC transporter permease [Rhizomonospora bruguierae]|uniref:ABC transporter permease n=1 Tax=Rhizomonospora bruguierae TaxID=1581705 RepID=UPI001BCCFC05|nr:ABC transporter permease [Micromonospora sp. NBRC 107566]
MTTQSIKASRAAAMGERIKRATLETLWRAYTGENSGILIVVVLGTIVGFSLYLRDTDYLTADNMLSIVRQTTAITVMAVPTVFVIASRELDLSFAAVVPVSGFVAALLLESHNMIVAVAASIGIGVAVGLFNGLVTVWFKIPSFVVTLGSMGVLNGLSLRITDSQAVSVSNRTFLDIFGAGSIGPVPSLLIWAVVIVALGHFVLTQTATGRGLLATGANEKAARYSGIRVTRMKVGALVASGVGGSLAGLLYVGQFAAASYTLGGSDLLTVIAAVIIGGTALAGGKGSVIGALIGSLLIGTLNNGLVIIGLANPEQLMVRGVIIIAAVIFSARTVRNRRRPASLGGDPSVT